MNIRGRVCVSVTSLQLLDVLVWVSGLKNFGGTYDVVDLQSVVLYFVQDVYNGVI